MQIIGIMGSKGKTSTLYILENIFIKCYKNVGVIGDSGIRINKNKIPPKDNIMEMIHEMKEKGVDLLIIEISNMIPVRNISFDCIIFSNIYDEINNNSFFKDILDNSKAIILNGDDEEILHLINGIKETYIITFGLKNKNTITATSISLLNDRMAFVYYIQRGFKSFYNNEIIVQEIPLELNLMGYQHIYNSLAAVTAGIFFNVSNEQIFDGISKIKSLPDRLELFTEETHKRFFIDNSNDINSLKVIFDTVQYLTYQRIFFGIYVHNLKKLLFTSNYNELFEELKLNKVQSIHIVGHSTENIDQKQLKTFINSLSKHHIDVKHYGDSKAFVKNICKIAGLDDLTVWVGPRKCIVENMKK